MAGQHGKLGYIDKTGKFVILPQFAACDGFRDGFAYVYGWPSIAPDLGSPLTSPLPQVGPLAIIDLTGRVVYQALPASTGPTGSS
jgi:WG containing repeat